MLLVCLFAYIPNDVSPYLSGVRRGSRGRTIKSNAAIASAARASFNLKVETLYNI